MLVCHGSQSTYYYAGLDFRSMHVQLLVRVRVILLCWSRLSFKACTTSSSFVLGSSIVS